MSQSFDPVFGNWYTEKQLGSGTDGKAYTITRALPSGKKERAVLKTIRVGDYRNETKSFNKLGEEPQQAAEDSMREKIIQNITDNIDIIKQADGGKRFVKYESWETRKTSDGKGTLILIRLEEMKSLADVLESFSLTREETLRLGISLCKSLMRCRDFGYIYPNLKPENILFDRKGACKLGDFGSFSCLEPSKTSIAYKRTQYFMAPEFIKTGKINCTSDTYALGLVLYCLINRGRLPFTEPYPEEQTIASFDRSKQSRLDGLPFPQPAIPDEALCHIIGRACAFQPEERYLSPKQMLADLENALRQKPFEKPEFEDVYSVSSPSAAQQEAPQEEPKQEEPPREPVQLKEEIQIPDVTALDYAQGEPPKTRPRPVQSSAAPLPRVKQRPVKKRRKKRFNRRMLVLLIVAVCLLLLVIISLHLRHNASEQTQIVSQQAGMLAAVWEGSWNLWPMT